MGIGYACTIYSKPGLNFSTCRLRNASEERLNEIICRNLDVLDQMIDFNIENEIALFRISSDVIPFATHPINRIDWQTCYKRQLQTIGLKIRKAGMRVSMHPGQYTVLNSPNHDVVSRAISDIQYHTNFLDALEMDKTNKIIIHVGGVYGDKTASKARFIRNVKRLDSSARHRLVIENDDKSYNVSDILDIAQKIGNPCVFDTLHHEINHPQAAGTLAEWINICSQTWTQKDGVQKIHYSQQDRSKKLGAHSSTIQHHDFLNFYTSLDLKKIDIMLEVKDKEISAIKCNNLTRVGDNISYIIKEWNRYKLLVLSRSQSAYDRVNQQLYSNGHIDTVVFYDLIEQALSSPLAFSQVREAALSVFKELRSDITDKKSEKFMFMLNEVEGNLYKELKMKKWLYGMCLKYGKADLCESYYFLPFS